MNNLNYGNTKLTLGIVNVGFWVLVLSSHLLNLFNSHNLFIDLKFNLTNLTYILSFYVILQFLFDLFGGIILPFKFHKISEGLLKRLTTILRGIITNFFILLIFSYILIYICKNLNPIFILGLNLLLQFFLIFFQFKIASIIFPFKIIEKKDEFFVIKDNSKEITSTISGFLGSDKFLISSYFLNEISNSSFQIIQKRYNYIKKEKLRIKAIIFAILFNFIGFSISYLLFKPDSILNFTLFFSCSSIYAFFGLLLLPHLTHKATLKIDKACITNNLESDEFKILITKINSLQGEKVSRSITEDNIFQPLISVDRRLASLNGDDKNYNLFGWNLCRITTYLSIANISLINRSVHGNVGRPYFWVFLPSD